jgi:transposase
MARGEELTDEQWAVLAPLIPEPPAGIPSQAMPSKSENDPVLSSLSKLVKAVAPVNDTLALQAGRGGQRKRA